MVSRDTILQGGYTLIGEPWVQVAARSGIDLDLLAYSKIGEPWYGIESSETPPVVTGILRVQNDGFVTICNFV